MSDEHIWKETETVQDPTHVMGDGSPAVYHMWECQICGICSKLLSDTQLPPTFRASESCAERVARSVHES